MTMLQKYHVSVFQLKSLHCNSSNWSNRDFKNCSNSDIHGATQQLQTEKYMLYMCIYTLLLQNKFTLIQLRPVHITSFMSAGLNISNPMAMSKMSSTVTVEEVGLSVKHKQLTQTYQMSLYIFQAFISHHSPPNQNTSSISEQL